MDIISETKDNIVWIKISGRMVLDASLFRLRENVAYGLESGVRRFIIDLSEVSYLDSSGCGQVISAHTSIQRVNGYLAIVNPSERVRLVWTHTRLTDVFNVCHSLDEARHFVLR